MWSCSQKARIASPLRNFLQTTACRCPSLRGGVFTSEVDATTYVLIRDKDIAGAMTTDKRIGFMGSDTYEELDQKTKCQMTYLPIAETALRFTLATSLDGAEDLRRKIGAREPISVATSYSRAACRFSEVIGTEVLVRTVMGGSIEAAPKLFGGLDGVIDLTDSGETLRQNGMEIVVDNLEQVTIGAVWRVVKGAAA